MVLSSAGHSPGARRGKLLLPLMSVLAALSMVVAGVAIWLQLQERDRRQAKERELLLVMAERDDLAGQVRELEQLKSQIQGDLDRAQVELDGTRQKLAETVEANEELARSVDARQQEIDRLSKDLSQLKEARRSLAAQVQELEAERDDLDGQLAVLQDSHAQLETKLQELTGSPTVELDKVLVTGDGTSAGTSAPAPGPTSAAPGLNGQVIVVNREYDFIVMNLGKNHGLAVGQEFQIVRGEEVLGRVKVEKVYDELSAAALLPDAREDSIREGDAVRSL